jgi:hypothetical protein
MGGPLLVPATALAIVLPAFERTSLLSPRAWLSVAARGATVLAIAIAVFFVTTPYALLNSYFFETWLSWARAFSGVSPVSPTTFYDWVDATLGLVGPWLAAAGLGAILWVANPRTEKKNAAIVLATAAWSFLYYALFQKFWVQPQYLIMFYALVGVFSFYPVDLFLNMRPVNTTAAVRSIVTLLLATASIAILLHRTPNAMKVPLHYALWREMPHYQIGMLAQQKGLSPDGARILTDLPTYFAPDKYPDLVQNGGPIRYVDLARVLPDQFVLTRVNVSWQADRIAGPVEGEWEDHYANMRVYQMLLGRSATSVTINDDVDFAAPLLSFGWDRESGKTIDWASYPFLHSLRNVPILRNYIDRQASIIAGYRHVALFEFDKEKFIAAMPASELRRVATPFASSTAADASLTSLTSGKAAWRSEKIGSDAIGEYAGLVYPLPIEVSEVEIRWVAMHWLPRRIAVEYSDDGNSWRTAAEFNIGQPDDPKTRTNGTNRWSERFSLSPVEAHSHWRVRVLDIEDGNFFGMESIEFRTPEPILANERQPTN